MSGCILQLSFSHSPVFLLNSCLDLFSAPRFHEDPFSRSYGVNLPSSLTVIHPSASVYSTRPRVSVSVRVPNGLCLADFLGSLITATIGLPEGAPYCQGSALKVDLLNRYAYATDVESDIIERF